MLIAAIVLGLRYWMPSTPEPISLAVVERGGELQIEWNHAAKPVANATRGSLQILDGSESRTVALTPQVLASGKFTVSKKIRRCRGADDRGKRRRRQIPGSLAIPRPSAGCRSRSRRRSRLTRCCRTSKAPRELEAEVQRLRRENAVQSDKIQQLERTLRVLETRLNIDK